MKTCFSLLFSIRVLCSNAQIENDILYKEGTIVELTSRNPIPYTTIFIPSYQIGTYSDSKGNFRIRVLKNQEKDSLIISCVGYTSLSIAYENIKDTIFLTPSMQLLPEIAVLSESVESIMEKASKKYHDTQKNLKRPTVYSILSKELQITINQDTNEYYYLFHVKKWRFAANTFVENAMFYEQDSVKK